MTIRFILGRAGSGKTFACLDMIARLTEETPEGSPLIFLVPEQATLQMEKELLIRCNGGTFRAEVFSFRRLAYRLLQGQKASLPLISDLGRQMVLRRILQQQAGQLRAFGRAARQPRFSEKLAAQVREFKNYTVTPQKLRQASQGACLSALEAKLSDLADIYEAYHAFTDGRFSDPEDMLAQLASAIDTGMLPAGTRIWVDGFAGFTLQEYEVLSAILRSAAHMDVALCLDPRRVPAEADEDDLFHPTLNTYRRLRQMAGESGITAQAPLILPLKNQLSRFSKSPALSHLEENFNSLPLNVFAEKTNDIRLVSAANCRAEVEAAARDILHQLREKNWMFRDIAVVLRDLERYHDIVSAVFADFGIPYFLDRRRPASHHPLVELLRSALETALTNLKHKPVFLMLKTGFFPIDDEDIDRLENYVLAHGIHGSRWLDGEPWRWCLELTLDDTKPEKEGVPHDLKRVNQARDSFRRIYAPFLQSISAKGRLDASALCRALWKLLIDVGASETLQVWIDEEIKAGELVRAEEHRQVWQGIIAILDQVADIVGENTYSLQEFTEIFLSGLESLKLGLVPAALDQVVVGNVERSRQPSLKAVYILGLSEGDFPARPAEEGMFSDPERRSLLEEGMEMAETRRQKIFHEQYLSYIALTRSSVYLWASFPLSDDEGRAKRPSLLFTRLAGMFPSLQVAYYGNTPAGDNDDHYLAGVNHIAAHLLLKAGHALRGGELSQLWNAVYNEALQEPAVRRRMEVIWPALQYANSLPKLSAKAVDSLYGITLRSSVSRLELFARCPFAHFARYGLRLRERQQFNIEAPDMGIFYHAALGMFVDELLLEGIEWSALDEAEARERMAVIVDRLVPRLQGEILLSSARYRFLASQLKTVLTRAVSLLTEHARRGKFRPVAVEVPFGNDRVPYWQLPVAEGVSLLLSGRVDRVDLAEEKEKVYIRVIDYKSTSAVLRLSDIRHGISLQLPAYLAVVTAYAPLLLKKEAEPAGALYFAVNTPYTRVDNPPPDTMEKQKALRMNGIILADEDVFRMMGGSGELVSASLNKDGTFHSRSSVASKGQMKAMLDFTAKKLSSLASEVLSGDVKALPYRKANGESACGYCSYLPVCRFDLSFPGCSYRFLTPESHHDVLTAFAPRENDSEVKT